MSPNRIARPQVFRIAVLLSTLLSLICLVVPNEAVVRVDFLGVGKDLGSGTAEAADVVAVTVDNSTSATAVTAPTQRKLFHAADRFWVFYSDGTELVYRSSSDGSSWSDKSASLGAFTSGDGISVYFDGTYVHLVRTTDNVNEPLYYRRGIPGAGGAIAWSAAEQIAVGAVNGVRYVHPSVSVDSSGHALVSYHYEKQNGKAGEGPWVTKSANSDGTWGAAPAGFPYQLAADSESEWYTTVHGLTANKIAVTFADHTNIKGVSLVTHDGTNWNSSVTTISTSQSGSAYSAVAQGDDIHIVLLKAATYDLLYCKYTYSTNTLGAEYTLLGSTTPSSMPSLARASNNDLYCFWAGAPANSHIYYIRMISGVWEAGSTDWLTEVDLTSNGGVSAFYDQGGSSHVGLAWEAGAGSPYNVRFAAVSNTPPPNQPPSQTNNTLPVNGDTGQGLTPTLQSSAFVDPDAGDTHGASQWQVTATSGNYSTTVFDSQTDAVNLLSISVPAGRLSYSATYYWHVRHQDNHGDWSAWSVETSFATMSAPIQAPNQPDNTLPANGDTGQSLTPTLQSSDFSDPDSGDEHGASQWQITTSTGDYSSPVFDSQMDSVNLLNIMVPADQLSYSGTYYWHVRHQDNHGEWSVWSAETSFSTGSVPNQAPNQPGNTLPVNGDTGQSLTPTLQSSAFVDPDVGDTHGASQWQVTATSGNYSTTVFDSQTDAVNLLSILVPAGRLSYSSTYYWRVRHQDNHGDWSAWSAESSFSTISAPNQVPNQPVNAAPANGAVDQSLTPTLHSSALVDPDAGDTHGASQWQITAVPGDYSSTLFDSQSDNVNLLSILVPANRLSYSTTYYWRVRHQDNHGDWSAWSAETPFVTAAAPSTPPEMPEDENTIPAAPTAPPEEPAPDVEDTASASPDAGDGRGFLPFLLAVSAGIAAVVIVGAGLFLGYSAHVRSVNKPRGLHSARTISKRLRK